MLKITNQMLFTRCWNSVTVSDISVIVLLVACCELEYRDGNLIESRNMSNVRALSSLFYDAITVRSMISSCPSGLVNHIEFGPWIVYGANA